MTQTTTTLALLQAYDRGEITEPQILRHLIETAQLDGDYQAALTAWRRPALGHARNRPTLERLLHLVTRASPADWRAARRDLDRLLAFGPERRAEKMRRAISRYRSPLLAQLLLERSDERRAADPDEALHLAELAQVVLTQCPVSARADDLHVLYLAHRAAASKAAGDLPAAEEGFDAARARLAQLLAPDLRVVADLDQLEGSYRKDRRQLRRSEELLVRAATRYELLGDDFAAARTRLVLGAAQYYAGAIAEALGTTHAALTQLNSTSHQRLVLIGRYNIALFLADSGRPHEAATHFKDDLPLYRDGRQSWPNVNLHFHWLAGKIHRGLGELSQAEDHLTRARDGFATHGTAYDAILVCLDLALVYAAQRRHQDLASLADLMLTGFAAQGLHDAALAAVSLAAEAARQRRLTEDLARQVAHYLQFAQHDPSLKWRVSAGDRT